MLKELRKKDWLSLLGIPEELIPPVLILRGTRNLKHHYHRYAEHFSEIFEIGSSNGFLEDVFIGKRGSNFVGYASVYGGSMASEIVHIFGELGTKRVIQTGCCGGINEELMVGDFIVPHRAFSGEGVAKYYSRKRYFEGDHIDIEKMSENFVKKPIRSGQLFTTAALLAEGRDEIAEWSRRGFDAVDMETAAVFSVAEAFGMHKSAILFVSDQPYSDTGLLNNQNYSQLIHESDDVMVELVVSCLCSTLQLGVHDKPFF